MADLAQKCIFLMRKLGQLFVCFSQLARRAAEFFGFGFKLARIFHDLRRLIRHSNQIIH